MFVLVLMVHSPFVVVRSFFVVVMLMVMMMRVVILEMLIPRDLNVLVMLIYVVWSMSLIQVVVLLSGFGRNVELGMVGVLMRFKLMHPFAGGVVTHVVWVRLVVHGLVVLVPLLLVVTLSHFVMSNRVVAMSVVTMLICVWVRNLVTLVVSIL